MVRPFPIEFFNPLHSSRGRKGLTGYTVYSIHPAILQQEEENQESAAVDPEKGWPVAYHGTSDMNAIGIAKEGFRVDKGKRSVFGNGIYATPYPETALKYAKEYEYNVCMFSIPGIKNEYGYGHKNANQNVAVYIIRPYVFLIPTPL